MAPVTKAALRKAKAALRRGNMGPRKLRRAIRLPGSYDFTRYASSTIGTGLSFTLSNLLTENTYNFTFALNRLQSFTDFTNLFDLYQINKVDLYFRLVQNPDNTPQSSNAPGAYYPCLWYTRDYDDEVGLTLAQIREKQNVKRFVLRPNVIKKLSINPKFQKMTYNTLTTTGYGPSSGYLDTVDSGVPHYGLKTVMEVPASGASWQVEVNAKYHISFKHPQ